VYVSVLKLIKPWDSWLLQALQATGRKQQGHKSRGCR
jgi:hypothetical protein